MGKRVAGKLKRWFSSRKLKQKVRYLVLAIIALYLLLFFFIYMFFIEKSMMNYTLESNYKTMVSIGNNLNSELNTIKSMSQLIMTNSNIAAYLMNDSTPGSRYAHNAITSIYDISNNFNYINSIYLYRLNWQSVHIARGITYVNTAIMKEDAWLKEVYDANGGCVIRINGNGAYITKSGEPLISMIRVVNDIDTQKPIGLLVVNLSSKILEDSYKDMEGNGKQFYYCDESFKPIRSVKMLTELNKLEITGERFNQTTTGNLGNKKIVSYYHIPNTPFIIVGIEKMSYADAIPSKLGWVTVALAALTIFSLTFVSIFISRYITSPIERLVQSMDIVKRGWLKRVSLSLPDDEIGRLKDSYNNMLVEINNLISQLIEKEKKMQKAELDALQEQIKPHFLYNTLDTIAYLALMEPSEKVYDAIVTLGNFYRKFLSSGSKEISLREEIGIVKDYLKLQKLRYEDVFEDEYELDESLLDKMVPKLILQPLVENSLYHGLRPKGEKGVIKISVFKKEDKIHIVIFDNGIGMNEERLSRIMDNSRNSFGFKGTIERIQYYFGTDDVYDIESVEGWYTRVDIKIPI
ncbi:MAG: sensor histidine kinase [Clostridiaceae bacterium]|nr:sensor histidine kinase [Clostridiaceae bacterium]